MGEGGREGGLPLVKGAKGKFVLYWDQKTGLIYTGRQERGYRSMNNGNRRNSRSSLYWDQNAAGGLHWERIVPGT